MNLGKDSRTLKYEYDLAGRKTRMQVQPDNFEVTYGYQNNRLSIINSPAGNFGFEYDDFGRRKKLNKPNNTYTEYSYDANSMPLSIAHKKSDGALLQSFEYARDNVGNIINTITSEPGFDMDTLENQSKTYNSGNQIQNDISFDYSYDNSGNLTSKANRANPNERTDYTYDYENRLIQAVIKDSTGTVITTAQYKYDPFGRRIEKNVNGVATKYLYDEEDIVAEYDGAGNVVTRYVHGPDIDEPLAMIRGGQNYFYHADNLGSINFITDQSQAVIQRYAYDAFGGFTMSNPSFIQPYTFTAREYDLETGLLYYRERTLDPNTGTFIQKDPIGFAGGDVNLYRYVYGNSINKKDPYGLFDTDYGFAISGIFLDFAFSSKTEEWNVTLTTPSIGIGGYYCINICNNENNNYYVETPSLVCHSQNREKFPPYDALKNESLNYTVGLGRRSGLSFSDDFCTICINYGASFLGTTITAGLPMEGK